MMNQGQEQFLSFILERVQEDKIEEAKALLSENFRKQAEGTFTKEDVSQFAQKIILLLKPENIDEVQSIMKEFAQNM